MKESFNADEFIKNLNQKHDGIINRGRKENKAALTENKGILESDKAELIMEDLIETTNTENVDTKITQLEEILEMFPELSYATKKKIEDSIKNTNSKIIGDKTISIEDKSELFSKSRSLKKITEHLISRKYIN